jgi:hypothetical protein
LFGAFDRLGHLYSGARKVSTKRPCPRLLPRGIERSEIPRNSARPARAEGVSVAYEVVVLIPPPLGHKANAGGKSRCHGTRRSGNRIRPRFIAGSRRSSGVNPSANSENCCPRLSSAFRAAIDVHHAIASHGNINEIGFRFSFRNGRQTFSEFRHSLPKDPSGTAQESFGSSCRYESSVGACRTSAEM